MAAVCGGGGRSCVGGGGGSGDGGGDDGGATEAAVGTALQQTSRVVAATRLDFYSAFALWAWATAGVRLEPHSHCRVWSGGFWQPMSLSKPKRCPSRRLPSRLPARLHAPAYASMIAQDLQGWRLPASLQVPATTARPLSQARRGGTQRPPPRWWPPSITQAALGASELRLWATKMAHFSKPSHAPATSLV